MDTRRKQKGINNSSDGPGRNYQALGSSPPPRDPERPPNNRDPEHDLAAAYRVGAITKPWTFSLSEIISQQITISDNDFYTRHLCLLTVVGAGWLSTESAASQPQSGRRGGREGDMWPDGYIWNFGINCLICRFREHPNSCPLNPLPPPPPRPVCARKWLSSRSAIIELD